MALVPVLVATDDAGPDRRRRRRSRAQPERSLHRPGALTVTHRRHRGLRRSPPKTSSCRASRPDVATTALGEAPVASRQRGTTAPDQTSPLEREAAALNRAACSLTW